MNRSVLHLPRTVFDPHGFSDAQMNAMARDAGSQGWARFQAGEIGTGPSGNVYVVEQNGLRFNVYINSETATGRPIVGNVHPVP